jgi:hypothetical protein
MAISQAVSSAIDLEDVEYLRHGGPGIWVKSVQG